MITIGLLIKVITKKVDETSVWIALEIGDRKGFVQLPWLKICHQINHYSVHIHAYAEICQIIGKWRPYLKIEWNTFQLKHIPTNELVLMPTKIKLSRFHAKTLTQILNGQYYLYAGFKVRDTVFSQHRLVIGARVTNQIQDVRHCIHVLMNNRMFE